MDAPLGPPPPRRPWSIVDFERILLGSLALGVLKTWLDWDLLIAQASESNSGNPVGFTLFTLAFSFGSVVLMTLLVSRGRSRIAMWVSVVLYALGLPMVIGFIASGMSIGSPALTLLQSFAQLVGYGLLFTPSARRWLRKEPEVSPEIFR